VDISNNEFYPDQTKNVEHMGNISLMPLSKVRFSVYILSGNICSTTCKEILYKEFYFKSDAIYIQDGTNFHVCCKKRKYDIHCTHFHETSLCEDLLYKIPLQLVFKKKWKLLVYIHSCHQVWLSLHQFSQSSRLLTTSVKTPTLN
jgi:hypothetical protein